MINSLEFYQDSGEIFVDFNDLKKIPFRDFLKSTKAQKIINKMYIEIITKYKHKIKEEVEDLDNIGTVVGYFIKKFFLKKDKTYDVVLLGGEINGEVIKFNLEDH